MKETIKTLAKEVLGLQEWKQHKPQFDKECLCLLDQSKHAKIQWLRDPNQSNVDNRNNARRGSSRHFRNKKREYLKAKIYELETKSKIRYIKDLYLVINDFKKGYQARSNIVKDGKGDQITDSHSILARWRNHFSQLFNVHGADDVSRVIHTAKPIMPESSAFDVGKLLKS